MKKFLLIVVCVIVVGCGGNATVKGSEFEHADHIWVVQSHPDHNDWIIYCDKNSRPVCVSVWRGADYKGMPERQSYPSSEIDRNLKED